MRKAHKRLDAELAAQAALDAAEGEGAGGPSNDGGLLDVTPPHHCGLPLRHIGTTKSYPCFRSNLPKTNT